VDARFGGLDPQVWDQLAGRHFYSTSAWLGYCAADIAAPSDGVVVHRDGHPVLAAPVRQLSQMPSWSRYRWNDHLKESGLPTLSDTGTLIGPSEGFQTHFLSSDPEPRPDAVAELIRELRAAGPPGACVAMYATSETVRAARAAGATVEPVLLDADAWIPIPEGGWAAWLETFPSKRRRNIVLEAKAFDEAGYRVVQAGLAEYADQLGRASAATLRKYGHETKVDDEVRSLHTVAEAMGHAARVAVLLLPDDTAVGFCIYYEWADTIFVRWGGLDYDRLVGAAEYFNLMYYSQIRRAPEIGARWIHAGATALAGKALRGGELRPLWMLDLTEDSQLARSGAQIRSHNARMYADLAADPRIAKALVPDELWS
jgi:hypothetical protein